MLLNTAGKKGFAACCASARTVDELATAVVFVDAFLDELEALGIEVPASLEEARADVHARYWPLAERLALTGERDAPPDPRSESVDDLR
jgi:hypothetical protein